MNIGIIGYGVVGKAIEAAFMYRCSVLISDPKYPDITKPIKDIVKCEVIFIAVPTPMKDWRGGPFDSTIIDGVMNELSACKPDPKPIIVIESAVIPSKVREYLTLYKDMRLVISPEFLTDKESFHRFINPDCRILGGSDDDTRCVQEIFENFSACKPCKVGYCDQIGAAVIKYMENCFLALKVSFMNQFYDLLASSGSKTDWEHLATIFHYDTRMGNSHYHVPGPDGDRGWGGKCFAKDINAICYYAHQNGVDLSLMDKVLEYNMKIRKDIDWAAIEGVVSNASK